MLRRPLNINSDLQCWTPEQTSETLVFRDCLETIGKDIVPGREADRPFKFSHDASKRPDIRLPASWIAEPGHCLLGINFLPGETGSDFYTLTDLRQVARALAIQCVIQPPHVGGVVRIGWYNKMGLTLVAEGGIGGHGDGNATTETE